MFRNWLVRLAHGGEGEVRLGKLRKWTTPYHYICGALTILGSIHFGWWVAPLCFLCFLGIEVWNKKEWAASQNDFWEYTAGVFITLGLCLVLM